MKENNKTKMILIVIGLIILLGILAWLGYGYIKKKTLNISNPIVTMEVKDYGTIKIELYPDKAPNTVKNFIKLANNGYYDGLKFHRVVKDFMIQGGDSEGDGTGSVTLQDLNEEKTKKEENEAEAANTENEEKKEEAEAYSIVGEMLANGFTQNDLNLTEGVIAMARADYTNYSPTLAEESYNSAGSQFFIMTTNNHTNLSGYYAGFGKVIEGIDVVKKIEDVEVKVSDNSEQTGNTEKSVPTTDVIITSVKVDTFGFNYGMPETLKPFDYMQWLYSMYGLSM